MQNFTAQKKKKKQKTKKQKKWLSNDSWEKNIKLNNFMALLVY